MATEFERFSSSYAEKSKNTIKTYNNAYKKLHDELEQKDIHKTTSKEIFDKLDKFDSANTRQSLLNVAIGVWKVYDLDTDDLIAYREDLAKSIKQSVKSKNKALQEHLPSYDELVKHTIDCFNTGKYIDDAFSTLSVESLGQLFLNKYFSYSLLFSRARLLS
jgi:hypothetical protein